MPNISIKWINVNLKQFVETFDSCPELDSWIILRPPRSGPFHWPQIPLSLALVESCLPWVVSLHLNGSIKHRCLHCNIFYHITYPPHKSLQKLPIQILWLIWYMSMVNTNWIKNHFTITLWNGVESTHHCYTTLIQQSLYKCSITLLFSLLFTSYLCLPRYWCIFRPSPLTNISLYCNGLLRHNPLKNCINPLSRHCGRQDSW